MTRTEKVNQDNAKVTHLLRSAARQAGWTNGDIELIERKTGYKL